MRCIVKHNSQKKIVPLYLDMIIRNIKLYGNFTSLQLVSEFMVVIQ